MNSNYSEQFVQNLKETLLLVQAIIDDMKVDGHTQTDPSIIDMWVEIIEQMDPYNVICKFCDHHSKWENIFLLNTEFFKSGLKEVFPDLDVSMFAEIVECYEKLKRENPGGDQDDWAVTDDHIEALWDYFKSYVTLSCKFIDAEMRPVKLADGKRKYTKTDEFGDIDVEGYVKKFNIQL